MNKKTVIGLNAPDDTVVYVSLEDIEYAGSYTDALGNKYTELGMKSGNKVRVWGSAYHILDLERKREACVK